MSILGPSPRPWAAAPPAAVENAEGGRLLFRWRGSIGLVDQRDAAADTRESRVFDQLPRIPGVAALVVSGAVVSDPALPAALWQVCGKLFVGPAPHRVLWLIMPGSGRPDAFGNVCAQALADSFGVEVIAPTGELVVVPGGSVFAVGNSGGAGWNRFRRGAQSAPAGYRLPRPGWEAMLPAASHLEGDLVFEHVPAGLLVRNVRSRHTGSDDPAWGVPVDARHPLVLLGCPGEDDLPQEPLVAGLRRLPPQLLDVARFVPGAAGSSGAAWSQRLTELLGRRVVVGAPAADGSGGGLVSSPDVWHSHGAPAEGMAAAPRPPAGPVAVESARGAEAAKSAEESTVVIQVGSKVRPATSSSGPSAQPGLNEPPTVRLSAPINSIRAATHELPPVPGGHVSTGEERAAFQTWAAEAFNDAVGVVNAALALLPALRGSDEDAARVDLVAVRLYLGGGARGGAELNDALRDEDPLPCSAYLACLSSGLRRLPVQRGPVFRQSGWSWQQDVREAYPLGAVLSEPGLLSAVPGGGSVVPDLPVDIGIWSRAAHRTSALAVGDEAEEVVFCQRSRFKVLAVDDGDARPAVLLGELAAGAAGGSGDLTEQDLAVAAKLREALHLRRAAELSAMGEVQALRFRSPVGLVARAAEQTAAATTS
ncbi:hypothetical protein AB0L13_23580 [Saccharopolyspora shandongensis]|uniref:hypothetical protein n=1 Tax=Saccharopolyspora shandongensis TaxID=418495 RepID=UPI003434FF0C